MVSLPPSSRPASYVRSFLEGMRANRAVLFPSWHDVDSGVHSDGRYCRATGAGVKSRVSPCIPGHIYPVKAGHQELGDIMEDDWIS